jgi:hypothetical protein
MSISKLSFKESFALKPFSIYFESPTLFLYLICTLKSHLRFLYLGSEKLGTEDDYIWIAI